MSALYAETSAVLRGLLEGDAGLLASLKGASTLVTSALTSVEAARALARAERERRLTAHERREADRFLRAFVKACHLVALDDTVLDRARDEFPAEPVRTLDALHLASALAWDHELGDIAVLSVDQRVRANAAGLGLEVVPEAL